MIRIVSVFTATLLLVAGLAACGGGSVSSGGGGSRSAENLVVKVNSNGTAFFQTDPRQESRMLAAITDFFISEANATQPEGHTVTVYDGTTSVAEGTTDENGEARFILGAGTYTVCIDNADPSVGTGCVDLTVAGDSIVTATVTCDAAAACSLSDITEEDVTPVSDFQDPDNSEKVIICHIPPGNPDNQRTLSVGQESLSDHLGHGDSTGPCPEPDPAEDDVEATGNNGNGNGNGNGNRPEHAGPPSGDDDNEEA